MSLTKNVRGTFEEKHPRHGSHSSDTCTGVTVLGGAQAGGAPDDWGAASLPRAVSSSTGHFFGKVLLLLCYWMLLSENIFVYMHSSLCSLSWPMPCS